MQKQTSLFSLFVDIDECSDERLNRCQQYCTNTEGGFTCSCKPGYIQIEGNKCEGILHLPFIYFMLFCKSLSRQFQYHSKSLIFNFPACFLVLVSFKTLSISLFKKGKIHYSVFNFYPRHYMIHFYIWRADIITWWALCDEQIWQSYDDWYLMKSRYDRYMIRWAMFMVIIWWSIENYMDKNGEKLKQSKPSMDNGLAIIHTWSPLPLLTNMLVTWMEQVVIWMEHYKKNFRIKTTKQQLISFIFRL